MMCGGKSADRDADPEVQSLLDTLKDEVKQRLGHDISELKAVKFATQVVAGTNYFIKAHIGDNKYIHLRVFQPLSCNGGTPKIHSIQTGKSETEPIQYF